jgi:hypothetical protein
MAASPRKLTFLVSDRPALGAMALVLGGKAAVESPGMLWDAWRRW